MFQCCKPVKDTIRTVDTVNAFVKPLKQQNNILATFQNVLFYIHKGSVNVLQ